jgi:very-short-patch-repair endonuclease
MSDLEDLFAFQLKATGLPTPIREHVFASPRRWRFDFAWPDRMIAVEIDGGTWINGRHNGGAGYVKDSQKYNAAVIHGWRVLRFPGESVENGEAITTVEQLLSEDPAC